MPRHTAPVAQRIEHPPPKRGAAGSIPAGRTTPNHSVHQQLTVSGIRRLHGSREVRPSKMCKVVQRLRAAGPESPHGVVKTDRQSHATASRSTGLPGVPCLCLSTSSMKRPSLVSDHQRGPRSRFAASPFEPRAGPLVFTLLGRGRCRTAAALHTDGGGIRGGDVRRREPNRNGGALNHLCEAD
jgi:hypothetical protein